MRLPFLLMMLAVLLPVLAGCSGKMPGLGFGRRSQTAPAEVPPPVASAHYEYCAGCLLTADGRKVGQATTLRGFVETASRDNDMLVLTGWAADTETRAPAAEILFVARGEVIARSRPSTSRPDVAAALGLPAGGYGFQFRVRIADLGDPTAVYAIDRAGQALVLQVAQ